MMLFGNDRNEGKNVLYGDYPIISEEKIPFRRITKEEYFAVPEMFRSKQKIILSKPGIVLLVVIVWTICSMSYCFRELTAHSEGAFINLLIFGMVDLFGLMFSGLALHIKLDRCITRNSFVTVGEVVDVEAVRNANGDILYVLHTVALHGKRVKVVIREQKEYKEGSAVLIVKTKGLNHRLVNIPWRDADLSRVEKDLNNELSNLGGRETYEIAEYDKIAFSEAGRHYLSGEDIQEIPLEYRSVNPFAHGTETVCWIIFTLITAVMINFLAVSFRERNTEVFFPLVGGFLCEAFIELYISKSVLKNPLPGRSSYYMDCVVMNRSTFAGRCFVSVIIPARKQYIERIEIDPHIFGKVIDNAHMRLYFSEKSPQAKYVSVI